MKNIDTVLRNITLALLAPGFSISAIDAMCSKYEIWYDAHTNNKPESKRNFGKL